VSAPVGRAWGTLSLRTPPPLDLHAHVDPSIAPSDLADLRAVVFAVTRSLDEAQQALKRTDSSTVWGVGCHPGLVASQKDFSTEEFSRLLDSTAFAGELGLDGKSRVPLAEQRLTLRSALDVLVTKPRVVSLHSYAATEALIDELEATRIKGAVLHWWLGDALLTERALRLGCYFSVNASSARKRQVMAVIPPDRLLTETDHPFGDRRSTGDSAPGFVDDVERAIARHHGLTPSDARLLIWRNLSRLVREVGCSPMLPRQVRAWLAIAT
jgi:TatD DNase family protein